MRKLSKKAFIIRATKLIVFVIVLIFIVFLVKNNWNLKEAVDNMLGLFNAK